MILMFSDIASESPTKYSARVLEMISSGISWFEKCEFFKALILDDNVLFPCSAEGAVFKL